MKSLLSPEESQKYQQTQRVLRRYQVGQGDRSTTSMKEDELARNIARLHALGGGKKTHIWLVEALPSDGCSWALQGLMDRAQRIADFSVFPWQQGTGTATASGASLALLAPGFARFWSREVFLLQHGTLRNRLRVPGQVVIWIATYLAALLVNYTFFDEPFSPSGAWAYVSHFELKRHLIALVISVLPLLLQWLHTHSSAAGKERPHEDHYELLRNRPRGDFAPLRNAYEARAGHYPLLNVVDAGERLDQFDQEFLEQMILKGEAWRRTAYLWIVAYSEASSTFVRTLRAKMDEDSERFEVKHCRLVPMSLQDLQAVCKLLGVPPVRAEKYSQVAELVSGKHSSQYQKLRASWESFTQPYLEYRESLQMTAPALLKYLALSGSYEAERFTLEQIADCFGAPRKARRAAKDKRDQPAFARHVEQRQWRVPTRDQVLSWLRDIPRDAPSLMAVSQVVSIPAELRRVMEEKDASWSGDNAFIHLFWAQHYGDSWKVKQSLDDLRRAHYHLSRARPGYPGMASSKAGKALAGYLDLCQVVASHLLDACRLEQHSALLVKAFNLLMERQPAPLEARSRKVVGGLMAMAWENFFLSSDHEAASAAERLTFVEMEKWAQEFATEIVLLRRYEQILLGRRSPDSATPAVEGSLSSSPRLAAFEAYLSLESEIRFAHGSLQRFARSKARPPEPVWGGQDELLLFEFKLLDRLASIHLARGQWKDLLDLLDSWWVRFEYFRKSSAPFELLQRTLVPLYAARAGYFLLQASMFPARAERRHRQLQEAFQRGLQRSLGGLSLEQLSTFLPPVPTSDGSRERALELAGTFGAQGLDQARDADRALHQWVLDQFDTSVALAELMGLTAASIEAHFGRAQCLKDFPECKRWEPEDINSWEEWDEDLNAILEVEGKRRICLRSHEVHLERLNALSTIPALVVSDAVAWFKVAQDFGFALQACMDAYGELFSMLTAAGQSEQLPELIEAIQWWIRQIEADPNALQLCDWIEEKDLQIAIIDSLQYLSQTCRLLDRLPEADQHLSEAEKRYAALPADKQEPDLAIDLALQRAWLLRKQEAEIGARLREMLERSEWHARPGFVFVIATALDEAPDPLPEDLLQRVLVLLFANLSSYVARPVAEAAIDIARKARGQAAADPALQGKIADLLLRAEERWRTARRPDVMVNLYGELRHYDPANANEHQIRLDMWVRVELESAERGTRALYSEHRFAEVLALLLKAFRYHVQLGIGHEDLKRAEEAAQSEEYEACLDILVNLEARTLENEIQSEVQRILVRFERLEYLRLKELCQEKKQDQAARMAAAQECNAEARGRIPDLLEALIALPSLDDSLRETLKAYLAMHNAFS